MIRLQVNVDHVATVRQARRTVEPDPVAAGILASLGGADGITVHLREDRRHIQERDVRLLRQVINRRLNLEMAAVDSVAEIALAVKPDEATLVPERREELTTEGGLDIVAHQPSVSRIMSRLADVGIQVALFIDPDPRQIEVAKLLRAHAVELQTARYAEVQTAAEAERELAALADAASFARQHELHVHMGHGLTYANVGPVARLAGLEELNIGHSIIARSMLVGIERAVREMAEAIRRA